MEKIHVQTFGNFEVTSGGQVFRIERSQSTKTAHLLQYLMINQGKAFEKGSLVDILYREGEVSDPLNNLKVNIFRLRQMLETSGLPGGKHILHKKGCYSWNGAVELDIDLDQFRTLLDHAGRTDMRAADRVALMMAAIELYKGEFLPGLRGEEWVGVTNAECRKRYIEAVCFVCDYYHGTDNYEREYAVLSQAVEYFPYEEVLRELQLRCLISRKMYREAMELYDEVSRRLMDELGLVPSQEMSRLHQALIGELDTPITTFADLKKDICEDGTEDGAYNCSYVAFIDTSRLIARYVQRIGQSASFVLCTLTDASGAPLPAGSRLQDAAAAANKAVKSSLRRGDLYTRYGPSQFLILLIGATKENCPLVSRRIDEKFARDAASRGIYFRWEYESINAIIPADEDNAGYNH